MHRALGGGRRPILFYQGTESATELCRRDLAPFKKTTQDLKVVFELRAKAMVALEYTIPQFVHIYIAQFAESKHHMRRLDLSGMPSLSFNPGDIPGYKGAVRVRHRDTPTFQIC
jgi:hypothetical protein